jgi:hypothetical protein
MRKYIFLVVGMLMIISAVYSQRVTITEDFDSTTVSLTSTPANAWSKDNLFTSPPYSYRGKVPHAFGDSVMFTTRTYDFSSYTNVMLRFKHICKISPQDRGVLNTR